MINYYQELQIDDSLDKLELEKDIIKKQKKWLNRTNSSDLEKRNEAQRMLQVIEDAKNTLLDENLRNAYDNQLVTNRNNEGNSNSLEEVIVFSNEKINQLIQNGQTPQAIAEARNLTDIAPNDYRSWKYLAHAHREFGNEEIAKINYIKALELNPTDLFSYLELGYIHKVLKDYNHAINYFKQALTIKENNQDSLRELGVLYRNLNNYDLASEYLKILNELYPTEENKDLLADTYFLKAESFMPTDSNRERYYFFEEEKITEFINLVEKANTIYPTPEYEEKIKEARKALKKTYDWGKITLLTLPFFFIYASEFLSFVLFGVILYFSIRPRWIIQRRDTFGITTTFDTIASVYTKTVGYLIIIVIALIGGIFGAAIDTTRYK